MVVVVDAPVLSPHPQHEQRQEDQVEGDDRSPEVDLPEAVVQHPPEHLREPIGERGKGADDGDREERVVEVGQDEIRVVEEDVRPRRTQEDPRHTADQERGDEGQGPEHGRVQRDRPTVEGGDVHEAQFGDGNRDEQRRDRE